MQPAIQASERDAKTITDKVSHDKRGKTRNQDKPSLGPLGLQINHFDAFKMTETKSVGNRSRPILSSLCRYVRKSEYLEVSNPRMNVVTIIDSEGRGISKRM